MCDKEDEEKSDMKIGRINSDDVVQRFFFERYKECDDEVKKLTTKNKKRIEKKYRRSDRRTYGVEHYFQ